MQADHEPGRMTDAPAWTPRTTPLVPPVYHAVTYELDDKSYEDITAGGLTETWYGRFSNPTVAAAEPIRRLEGTPAGLLTASGMAAIATTLVTHRRAQAVLRELRLFTEATSLGGVESLASTPFNSSHFALSPADRAAAGIGPGTLRLSVGLEDPDALLADLTAALDATREEP